MASLDSGGGDQDDATETTGTESRASRNQLTDRDTGSDTPDDSRQADADNELTDRDPGSDGGRSSGEVDEGDAGDELTDRDPGGGRTSGPRDRSRDPGITSGDGDTTQRDPSRRPPRGESVDELTDRDQGSDGSGPDKEAAIEELTDRDQHTDGPVNPRDDAIEELSERDQASRRRNPRATQTRARQIARENVDATLQEGLEGVQGNPLQQQAISLEQQAIAAYAWADDPSDIAVVQQGDQLVALPSRSARVEATADQLVDQAQERQPTGPVETERDRAEQALEAQLEEQTGVDLEPGEDFVVEQTGDGRWQARLLPGFGDKAERIEQARQEGDIFSGAVATVEDVTGMDVPGDGSVVNEARVEQEFADADDAEQFGDWVINVPGTDRRAEDFLESGSEWTQQNIWQPVAGGASALAGSPVGAVAGAAPNPGGGIQPEAERRARARGAIEGGGALLDPAGLALTGKEAVEFVGGFGETQPLRGNGETSEFLGAAAGAGALALAGFTQQARDEPQRTTGQVVGSLAGSGVAIRGARAAGGARTGRAVSVGIQPGEELAITAARSGVVPSRVARAVPGVRQGHIEGRSETSDRGFLADDRGQLDLVGTRSETDADSGSVASEMETELRRMEQAVRRREARERAEQRVRDQAGDEGPPDPITVEGQPESQVRTAEGQPAEQIRTANPARSAPESGPTTTQQAAWRSGRRSTGDALSPRQRQLVAQRQRDAGDLVPMGDLREVDAGVRALEARFADQQALSVTQQAGATGGMAGAVTFGAQQRLQDAQTPQVTLDEVLQGRPDTLVGGTTGTGVGVGLLDTEADAVASISDFQGNLADTETRADTAQEPDVRTDVTPTELEETAQDVASEARERVAQDRRQEMQQEQDARQRTELRQEPDEPTRFDDRTEVGSEQRSEPPFELRQEPPWERRLEPPLESDTDPGPEWEFDTPAVGGRGLSVGASDDQLYQGWLTETFFTVATGGQETPRAPSQEVLEGQPGSAFRTGEFPVAFSDEAEAEAFADVQAFFDPTTSANDDQNADDFALLDFGDDGATDDWDDWEEWV